ncbi:unnamed protein product [Ostreobium quekettii]|uniref:Ribosomal RNA-processing protein 40 n=1 Tax=Ostreobium quekettii TaxID=121088 RepID=A0A8S1JE68_9CHLO|nr:unnamed protein product [Ostreobium quekettii]|eukprot:evm.model.scf_89.25 EVM.evm.TU.scf_89.25   scf_89:140953-142060(-)
MSLGASQVLGPGDPVLELPESGEVRIGSGVRLQDGCMAASKAGRLQRTNRGKLWIKGRQKKYIPRVDDAVVGIVRDRLPENFIVDINGPFNADLPLLAFENVTRRNIPALKAGDLVYARVTAADRDLHPVLACTNALGKAAGMGPLSGGMTFSVSSATVASLLAVPPHPALAALGAAFKFEVVVGVNGLCWVDADKLATCVLVANCIRNCEDLGAEEAGAVTKRIVQAMAG